ncbi:RING-H2 finger protein ATL21A isoform X1 [Populus alba x Populus x berolinensis]|nr:RING-H2 finger protein ATL21A isoform X1 [Populus alba x Populus x berolinensis]
MIIRARALEMGRRGFLVKCVVDLKSWAGIPSDMQPKAMITFHSIAIRTKYKKIKAPPLTLALSQLTNRLKQDRRLARSPACSIDDVPVRFPFFRLECNHNPRNCGNPDDSSKTSSYLGTFSCVTSFIFTQQIQLYDSDNCLPKRLLQLQSLKVLLSLLFLITTYITFLSCPTQRVESRFPIIDCLSNSTITVLATSSTKLFHGQINTMKGSHLSISEELLLTWFSPLDSHHCETTRRHVGFPRNASQEIICSYNSYRGKSSSSRQVGILFLSIGIPVLVCASGMAMSAYLMMGILDGMRYIARRGTPQRQQVSPQPTILVMGLEESTIESFDKLVLGESKRLPGPNGSTCAICLSEYNSKETLRMIPECNHCFHADCVD